MYCSSLKAFLTRGRFKLVRRMEFLCPRRFVRRVFPVWMGLLEFARGRLIVVGIVLSEL